jgi:hypothetical protein
MYGRRMTMLETNARVNSIWLAEHETTGPLPVGFEFERSGASYDHFCVSTDGFIIFVRGTRRAERPDRVCLTSAGTRVGGVRVTYEVQGPTPRRRLLVSLAEAGAPGATLRVTVHERTGIVEIDPGGQSFGDPTMRQLERVQSSPSRVNSALKIG